MQFKLIANKADDQLVEIDATADRHVKRTSNSDKMNVNSNGSPRMDQSTQSMKPVTGESADIECRRAPTGRVLQLRTPVSTDPPAERKIGRMIHRIPLAALRSSGSFPADSPSSSSSAPTENSSDIPNQSPIDDVNPTVNHPLISRHQTRNAPRHNLQLRVN